MNEKMITILAIALITMTVLVTLIFIKYTNLKMRLKT